MLHSIFENVRFLNQPNYTNFTKSIFESVTQFLNEISVKQKNVVYDKAKNYIDNGVNEKDVIKYFKSLFEWLDKKKLLNDKGKEIIKSNTIDDSISLDSELLNDKGNIFITAFYNNILKSNKSLDKEIISKLDKIYRSGSAKILMLASRRNFTTYNDAVRQMEINNQFQFQQDMMRLNHDMAIQAHTNAVNAYAISNFGHPFM